MSKIREALDWVIGTNPLDEAGCYNVQLCREALKEHDKLEAELYHLNSLLSEIHSLELTRKSQGLEIQVLRNELARQTELEQALEATSQQCRDDYRAAKKYKSELTELVSLSKRLLEAVESAFPP